MSKGNKNPVTATMTLSLPRDVNVFEFAFECLFLGDRVSLGCLLVGST